jgi:NUMOD4 motif.
MSEWRTLPEFPKYEITSDGDVRNRESKKQLNEIENKKTGAWSYSLRRADGFSTCRHYEGLIYSAWPELKPAPKPKVVAPKKPKRAPRRKADEWRDIPGFPRYQISKDGILRYKSNKQLIKPKEGKVTLTTAYPVENLMQAVFGAAA